MWLPASVRAGLVVSRRESRNLYYSPALDRMDTLVAFLTENCCSLDDEGSCQPASGIPVRKRA